MPAKKDEEVKDDPALVAAEIRELSAKTKLHEAETKVAVNEARLKAAEAEEAELALETYRLSQVATLAADAYHHFYNFDKQVSEASVKECIKQLTTWQRTTPGEPIEICFNSPGGDVIAGLALFDYIKKLSRSGTYITTSTIGYSASMAGILLQAGDKRVIGQTAWIMIHEASFGASGKTGEIEDRVDWIKRVQDQFLSIFAERCAEADPATATKKLSKRQIKDKWSRTDWWINAEEALEYGLVDEIDG